MSEYEDGYMDGRGQGWGQGLAEGLARAKEYYNDGYRQGQIDAAAPILKAIADHEVRILRPIIIKMPLRY